MKTVLFIDEVAPKPYDPKTLATEGLGGTEATIIRVAEGLGKTSEHEIRLEQQGRVFTTHFDAEYLQPDYVTRAEYVVSIRSPGTLKNALARYPGAKHFLWNHDLMQVSTAAMLVGMTGFTAIAVSNFHKSQMTEVLKSVGYQGEFPIKVIYNPIDDGLVPDDSLYDKNQLCFVSSPHKGLEYTIDLFQMLRRFNPEFKLYICNPGYLPSVSTSAERVINLGSIPHLGVVDLLRSSLCLFNPNIVFPETFGLVLAEANAVGTPVIAHPIGAAQEVLCHPYEIVDCRDRKQVVDMVMSWYNGDRPRVKANPKFRLQTVLQSWKKLLT